MITFEYARTRIAGLGGRFPARILFTINIFITSALKTIYPFLLIANLTHCFHVRGLEL